MISQSKKYLKINTSYSKSWLISADKAKEFLDLLNHIIIFEENYNKPSIIRDLTSDDITISMISENKLKEIILKHDLKKP